MIKCLQMFATFSHTYCTRNSVAYKTIQSWPHTIFFLIIWLWMVIHSSIESNQSYCATTVLCIVSNPIQNSPAVKKCAAPKNAVVKKDVKSKVAAKK